MQSLYHLPIGEEAPQIVPVVVEIPKGTRNKIEYDPVHGVFRLDRVLYSPLHYPGDYGFIPQTLSLDGDALDVLVLVTDPTFTGCVVMAQPIGTLVMRDEKGEDEKILAVPAHDPRFEEVNELTDLPAHTLREVEHFFEIYKLLEGKPTALLGWRTVRTAHTLIQEAHQRFMAKYGSSR
ncbi:MAG: inorganic diphosphatase [Fimbriimonadales bacterium]|nr:inorganic diphosphatase [Fimbriimonadales bacterium]